MRARLAVLAVVVQGCPMTSPLVVVATLAAAVVAPAVVVVTAVVEVHSTRVPIRSISPGINIGHGFVIIDR